MALKILLADDSMTAQNMGKKILTEAGYNVIAVSNGAQAVKKIASEKPDIIILDVYMPGYTGLEVCERVKNALETSKIPVLLTVGKMEPFRMEEGSRVGADGLMIKPFEATDLVTAVQKVAEKLNAPAAPKYEDTIRMPVPIAPHAPEFQDSSYQEWKAGDQGGEVELQKARAPEIAVSSEDGGAPALGFEDFGRMPAAGPAQVEEPQAPPEGRFDRAMHMAEAAGAAEAGTHFGEPAPAVSEQPPHFETYTEAPPASPEPVPSEPRVEWGAAPTAEVPPTDDYVEFTSAPKAAHVDAEPTHEFEPTSPPRSLEPIVERDPNLVTDVEDMMQFTTKFGVEHPEKIPVGVAGPETQFEDMKAAPAAESEAPAPPAPAAEEAFESFSNFGTAPAAEATHEEQAPAAEAAPGEPAKVSGWIEESHFSKSVFDAPPPPVEAAPAEPSHEEPSHAFEDFSAPPAVTEPEPVAAAPEPQPEPEPAALPEPEVPVPSAMYEEHAPAPTSESMGDTELAAGLAAAIENAPVAEAAPMEAAAEQLKEEVAASGAAQGMPEAKIAEAVSRVIERFKAQMVAEIAKELMSDNPRE